MVTPQQGVRRLARSSQGSMFVMFESLSLLTQLLREPLGILTTLTSSQAS